MQANPIDLRSNEETTLEIFGKLVDGCRVGTLTLLANGTRVAGLLNVEAQELAAQATGGPGGLSPDNQGLFDSTRGNEPTEFTCCGVGFSGRYTIEFLSSVNVSALEADPDEFQCDLQEAHAVHVKGNLNDLARSGLVRMRAESPLNTTCELSIIIEQAQ